MAARIAARPKVRVSLNGDNATPPHLIYRTAYIEASVGRQQDRKRVQWRALRPDGSTAKTFHLKDGVSVCVGEENWEHSGVYLGIHSTRTMASGQVCEGTFEDFVTVKQLDDIIELLHAVRAKANDLGILTPRQIPTARTA